MNNETETLTDEQRAAMRPAWARFPILIRRNDREEEP